MSDVEDEVGAPEGGGEEGLEDEISEGEGEAEPEGEAVDSSEEEDDEAENEYEEDGFVVDEADEEEEGGEGEASDQEAKKKAKKKKKRKRDYALDEEDYDLLEDNQVKVLLMSCLCLPAQI